MSRERLGMRFDLGSSVVCVPDLLSYGSKPMDAETIRIISGILAVALIALYLLRRRKRLGR